MDYVVSWYLKHHTIEQITNDSVVTALFSEDGTSLVSYSHLPEKTIQKIYENVGFKCEYNNQSK